MNAKPDAASHVKSDHSPDAGKMVPAASRLIDANSRLLRAARAMEDANRRLEDAEREHAAAAALVAALEGING